MKGYKHNMQFLMSNQLIIKNIDGKGNSTVKYSPLLTIQN